MLRRVTLTIALAVMVLAALAHQPRAAFACSCVPPPSPLEARNSAVAVFAGMVSGIAPTGPGGESVLVTFDLQQTWKGPEGPQLTIATSGSSASCGVEFAQGEEYLVYGFVEDGQIRTNLCSRTTLLADAGEDLAALGAGVPVVATGAPVTTVDMGIPWLPLALGGVGVALVLAVGVGWIRRR